MWKDATYCNGGVFFFYSQVSSKNKNKFVSSSVTNFVHAKKMREIPLVKKEKN